MFTRYVTEAGSVDALCGFLQLTVQRKNESVVTQSCLTLCEPTDCSPLGSSVPGILQARRLECVAIPFSRGSS